MRTMNYASVVFLLVDSFNKKPIENAVITCNGNYGGYVYKGDGYYVYPNLEKYKYHFEIKCNGFNTEIYNLDVEDDETKNIICTMNYLTGSRMFNADNRLLLEVMTDEKPLKNSNVTIVYKNKIPGLRIIKSSEPGSKDIFLNSDFDTRLIYQDYIYNNNNIYISDYNYMEKCYTIKEGINEEFIEGTFLTPKWNLVTDKNGYLLFLLNEFFNAKDYVELYIESNGKSQNIKIPLDSNKSAIPVELKGDE